ncbi:MAG: AMP-binding protein [Verrucomicrobiota bacterium]
MNLQAQQLISLNDLLRQLRETNPFFSKKLKESGVTEDIKSLEGFTEKFPLLKKQDLVDDQKVNPPYGTNLTYPISAYTRFSQTSATSGAKPVVWLDTDKSWAWMVENWVKVYQCAGVSKDDRIFCAFSFGPFLGFWTAYEAAHELGSLVIPGGNMDTLTRIEMVRRHKVSVLCCTPTYAIRFFEIAREQSIGPRQLHLEKVLVAGEPGGSSFAFRKYFAEVAPGIDLIDHYGMTEVGPVAVRDPEYQDTLQIFDHRYLAELIDPETKALIAVSDEAVEGELVLTPLGRSATPVLRYCTGDLVRMKKTKGRTLLEGGIIGRMDDMVIVRGVNIYPTAIDGVLREFPQLKEYRVTLDKTASLPELLLEVELDGQRNEDIAKKMQERFHQVFALRIPVETVPEESLPRFEMKAKRWIIKE